MDDKPVVKTLPSPIPLGKRPLIENNTGIFVKTNKEKGILHTLKKEYNAKMRKKFGTKRPNGNKQFTTTLKIIT